MAGNNKGGDDFDTTFDFNDMPTPGGPPAPEGNDDAFGGDDFGGDDFGGPEQADLPVPGTSEFDDFGGPEEPIRQSASRPEAADDFDVGFDVEETEPSIEGGEGEFDFAEEDRRVAEGDDEIEEEVQPQDNRSFLSRFGMPIGIGVILVFAAGFGYAVVLPFMGINLTPQQEAPSFVSTPVGQPTGVAEGPGGFDLPTVQPSPSAPSLPSPAMPVPSDAPVPTGGPSLPMATPVPVNGPNDGVGLATPVNGLPPLVPTEPAGPETSIASEEIEGLLDLVAELREQVEEQDRRIAELETRPQEPVVPQPVVTPPEKPMVVEGWTLKGVTNGVGWIDGPGGFLEVREGTEIPNVGMVTGVTRYEDQWLVVTDAGIIVE